MAADPPFGTDPYTVIRDPESLPILVVRAVYNVYLRATDGDNEDKLVMAHNVIVAQHHRNGLLRVNGDRNVVLTAKGLDRTKELLRTAKEKTITKLKCRWVRRWAQETRKQNPLKYQRTWWEENDREPPA